MDKVKKAIDDKRNIKPNSLNAYIISISKLFKAVTDDKEFKNLDFLKEISKVKTALSKFKLSTQKNYLSAVIVGLDAMNEKDKYEKIIKTYREILDETHNKYIEDYESGEKSKTQEKNWVTMKELRKVMNSIYREILDRDLFKKTELNKRQILNTLQSCTARSFTPRVMSKCG